jgi:hypothetical protein
VEIIRVVCTGKGSHRENRMRSFNYGRLVTATYNTTNGIQWGKGYDDWRDGHNPLMKSYTFTCRRCSPVRVTQVKRRTLRTALTAVRASGAGSLDISQLPF